MKGDAFELGRGRDFRVCWGDLFGLEAAPLSLPFIWWGDPQPERKRNRDIYWRYRAYFRDHLTQDGIAMAVTTRSALTRFLYRFEVARREEPGYSYLRSFMLPYIRTTKASRERPWWAIIFYSKAALARRMPEHVLYEKPVKMENLPPSVEKRWRREDLHLPRFLIESFTDPGETILDCSSGFEALGVMTLALGRRYYCVGRRQDRLDTVIESLKDFEMIKHGR